MTQVKRAVVVLFLSVLMLLGIVAASQPIAKPVRADEPTPTPTHSFDQDGCTSDPGTCIIDH